MCLRNVGLCEVIDIYLTLGQSDKLTQWMDNIDRLYEQDKQTSEPLPLMAPGTKKKKTCQTWISS